MGNKIMVSIICATYNHENYIADAIESFLMQKTNFKYEILIHDDASTDKTADIVREYEKQYPDLIKPIYQTENQYSKGVKVGVLNLERAKGKYIASCEGDDFWTDPNKLQMQVDYLEEHPECSMCTHATSIVASNKENLKSYIRPNIGNKIFTVEEVIEGGGGLFATNSVLERAVFGKSRPDFYKRAPVGDYPSAIYFALKGTVYYIDEVMSAYRVGVKGSWTDREFSNSEKIIKHFNQIAHMLDEINEYTNYQYDRAINRTKKRNQWNILLEQGKFKQAKTGEFREFYLNLSIKNRIGHYMRYYCPDLLNSLKALIRKLSL